MLTSSDLAYRPPSLIAILAGCRWCPLLNLRWWSPIGQEQDRSCLDSYVARLYPGRDAIR